MHCYRGLRSANPEARFSRSVLARENPFSRPIVAETEFVITLDGHFSYYLPCPQLALSVHARMSVLALLLDEERTMRQHKNGGCDPSNTRSAVLQ
jgi:hypothetical protein